MLELPDDAVAATVVKVMESFLSQPPVALPTRRSAGHRGIVAGAVPSGTFLTIPGIFFAVLTLFAFFFPCSVRRCSGLNPYSMRRGPSQYW